MHINTILIILTPRYHWRMVAALAAAASTAWMEQIYFVIVFSLELHYNNVPTTS
jgi:hypothetical protein